MTKVWKLMSLASAAILLAACGTVEEQSAEHLNLLNEVACQAAGDSGMTAAFVNESVVGKTFVNSCDIAIYFDAGAPADAVVSNVTITQEDAGAGKTFGVLNSGANVDVRDSAFTTEDVAGQHVPIHYLDGATGTVAGNKVTGNHRSAIVIRGADTDVSVMHNVVTGSGLLAEGWAENGIQLDAGATGSIKHNTVSDHQYDGADSAGILLYDADGVNVQQNHVLHNDVGMAVWGNENQVSRNTVERGTYGVWIIGGANNHVINNTLVGGDDGVYGLLVFRAVPDALVDTKVIRNDVSGFETNILYAGDEDSTIQANITPAD